MFHNTLVLIQVSESQENQAKQQNARQSAWVSDEVSWSDTTAFHNNLVVGSSPTKSTTQSPTTEEISCHCAHAASAVADA